MTNAELLALLREAQAQAESVDGLSVALSRRIDAALAEHDAVPPSEDKVEWRRTQTGPTVFVAHLNDADMALRVDWERWYWKVTREGHTTTLDEAKAAAIAAAKGMR